MRNLLDIIQFFLNPYSYCKKKPIYARNSPFTKTEDLDLIRKNLQGDKKARQKLINDHIWLVVKIAGRYLNQGLLMPDLIEAGTFLLFKSS